MADGRISCIGIGALETNNTSSVVIETFSTSCPDFSCDCYISLNRP